MNVDPTRPGPQQQQDVEQVQVGSRQQQDAGQEQAGSRAASSVNSRAGVFARLAKRTGRKLIKSKRRTLNGDLEAQGTISRDRRAGLYASDFGLWISILDCTLVFRTPPAFYSVRAGMDGSTLSNAEQVNRYHILWETVCQSVGSRKIDFK